MTEILRRQSMCAAAIAALFLFLPAACAAVEPPVVAAPVAANEETAPPRDRVRIFAAASLTTALSEAANALSQRTNLTLIVSFASSSTLARQIENGAPADIFISADEMWMDYLQSRSLIATDSRRVLMGNRLVLIVPTASKLKRGQGPALGGLQADGLDIVAALGDGRLAIGDPEHVPAGRYAKAALDTYGLWNQLENRTARAGDVLAALKLVERGEAPMGIVYATDARASDKVRVLDVIAEGAHPRIVYPMALVKDDASNPVRYAYDYFASAEALAIFRRHGFTVAEKLTEKLPQP
jgi:molybdate transport system substrate-binding protein